MLLTTERCVRRNGREKKKEGKVTINKVTETEKTTSNSTRQTIPSSSNVRPNQTEQELDANESQYNGRTITPLC
ncbi:hypothetical protein PISMIDRAFT_686781 [Pisolithus microcarpus 441]|uniref:Uncharacterized protein n=1 Tax=Pisolithus microcarpus 441 TaxID=765257 RepID=A0A0C9YQI5_9AGAM|nr:hypothetical protein PISMIDRAFT_686781 [Pisolithus microcarpus 441]